MYTLIREYLSSVTIEQYATNDAMWTSVAKALSREWYDYGFNVCLIHNGQVILRLWHEA